MEEEDERHKLGVAERIERESDARREVCVFSSFGFWEFISPFA
jgi:hypothetical protein